MVENCCGHDYLYRLRIEQAAWEKYKCLKCELEVEPVRYTKMGEVIRSNISQQKVTLELLVKSQPDLDRWADDGGV